MLSFDLECPDVSEDAEIRSPLRIWRTKANLEITLDAAWGFLVFQIGGDEILKNPVFIRMKFG
jgi:hypothetical protein